MKFNLKSLLFENISYKFVSFLIALILWFTILGRRDFEVTRSFELDLNPAPGMVVATQSVQQVKIKVTGPRTALRRFLDGGPGASLILDVSKYKEGEHRVVVPTKRLDLPFGVKVVAVKPSEVVIRIEPSEKGK